MFGYVIPKRLCRNVASFRGPSVSVPSSVSSENCVRICHTLTSLSKCCVLSRSSRKRLVLSLERELCSDLAYLDVFVEMLRLVAVLAQASRSQSRARLVFGFVIPKRLCCVLSRSSRKRLVLSLERDSCSDLAYLDVFVEMLRLVAVLAQASRSQSRARLVFGFVIP